MAGRKGLKTVLLHRIAAFLIFRELAEETTEILSFFLAYPGFLECICNKSGNSENAFSYGERFDYDPNGNRVRKDLTLVRTFTDSSQYYANTERLMTDGEYAYKYDPAGNMTEKGNRYTIADDEVTFTETSGEGVEYWQYEFDLLNRLVAVTKNGGLIREYRYGPDGLRTVTVNYTTGETTHYQYEGNNLIFEKNVATDDVINYIYFVQSGQEEYEIYIGNQIKEIDENRDAKTVKLLRSYSSLGTHLAQVIEQTNSSEDNVYYYTTDHIGSVRVVSDKNGEVVWKGEYSSFGVLLFEDVIDTSYGNTRWFGGKPFDEETGLYYFNARYYDAGIGRFITLDPVKDGGNWYVYCANNPLRYVDKTGLYEVEYQNEENWTDDEKQAVEDAYNEAEEYVDNSIEYLEEHIKGLKEKDKDGNLDKAIENATKALKNFQKLQKGFKSKDRLVFSKKEFGLIHRAFNTPVAAVTVLTMINLENVIELSINKDTDFFKESTDLQLNWISHELFHVEGVHHSAKGYDTPWYRNPYKLSSMGNWKTNAITESMGIY